MTASKGLAEAAERCVDALERSYAEWAEAALKRVEERLGPLDPLRREAVRADLERSIRAGFLDQSLQMDEAADALRRQI